MKNSLFIFALAVSVPLAFSSCKKCLDCKGKDPNAGNGDVKQEYCGNKDERAKGEAEFRAKGYTDVKCDD